MIFQRVLFVSVVIACEVLSSFSLHSKVGSFPGEAQILNQVKTYGSLQNQMEFPLTTFVQKERSRRDVSSSVEEDNEKSTSENNDATQNGEKPPVETREDVKNKARQKQRVCKGLPICGKNNSDRRRQKRQTLNLPNNKLKRGIDQVMSLEQHHQAQEVDTYFNQLKEEAKPTQANCIGWFRRRGGSSTTSSSVDAAGAAADGGDDADTGGDADDSNLQTSRRLRARRRTTTRRSRRQN